MNVNPTHSPSDHSLLTSLIGGQQGSYKARCLLRNIGNVKQLSHMSIPELLAQGELTQRMAHRIHSAFELGQRSLLPNKPTHSFTRPEQVYQLVSPRLLNQGNEFLVGLYLNRRRHLIQMDLITKGTDWMTIVDPKQIYHKALLCRASGLILVHNHPSGDPTPSDQDLLITREVYTVGSILRIPLLDHIVIGGDSYVSLAALGLLTSSNKH